MPASYAADEVDVRRDMLPALATLTRGQRAVIVLRYFDDLTEQQTAEALGCSVGTVKCQTARAMAALAGVSAARGTPTTRRSGREGPEADQDAERLATCSTARGAQHPTTPAVRNGSCQRARREPAPRGSPRG